MKNEKRLNLRMEDEVFRKLVRLAKRHFRSANDEIQSLIDAEYDREKLSALPGTPDSILE